MLPFNTVTPGDRSVSFLHWSGQAANRRSLLNTCKKKAYPGLEGGDTKVQDKKL